MICSDCEADILLEHDEEYCPECGAYLFDNDSDECFGTHIVEDAADE